MKINQLGNLFFSIFNQVGNLFKKKIISWATCNENKSAGQPVKQKINQLGNLFKKINQLGNLQWK